MGSQTTAIKQNVVEVQGDRSAFVRFFCTAPFDWDKELSLLRSNPLRIRVAHPQSLDEERDALDIFRKDVGYYLTLGGSDVLTKAADTLEEIRERRQSKAKTVEDPLVAYIVRSKTINDSRDFITYEQGTFRTRSADTAKAIDLLDQLETPARGFFDPATQRGNRRLMEQLKR
jgi:hypothetical protein